MLVGIGAAVVIAGKSASSVFVSLPPSTPFLPRLDVGKRADEGSPYEKVGYTTVAEEEAGSVKVVWNCILLVAGRYSNVSTY